MTSSDELELQDLTQFLYQFPKGVIAASEDGEVSMMNPAAARLLATEIDESSESVVDPFPVLRRLAPTLFEMIADHPDTVGPITNGEKHLVDSRDGVTRFTVSAHRLRPGHLIISLDDITEERRLLNEQRERAHRLQRALLGRIDVADLEVGVTYLPAHRGDLSGGDWYDVIDVGNEQVALVVGDVVGHDIEASATMGQLRAVVRSFALVDADPRSVLDRTEVLARSIHGATAATLHYALIDRATFSVTYGSAGHPPPLLLRADGTSEFLTGGRRPVLAASADAGGIDASTRLELGDVLIMFTDGLIERRNEVLDTGLERLQLAAESLDWDGLIDHFVEDLVRTVLDGTNQTDDVCLLAVRR